MFRKGSDATFYGVAIAVILLGTIIFVFGMVGWYINAIGGGTVMALPFFKVIGGLIITALGYIQLELEMLRLKK